MIIFLVDEVLQDFPVVLSAHFEIQIESYRELPEVEIEAGRCVILQRSNTLLSTHAVVLHE